MSCNHSHPDSSNTLNSFKGLTQSFSPWDESSEDKSVFSCSHVEHLNWQTIYRTAEQHLLGDVQEVNDDCGLRRRSTISCWSCRIRPPTGPKCLEQLLLVCLSWASQALRSECKSTISRYTLRHQWFMPERSQTDVFILQLQVGLVPLHQRNLFIALRTQHLRGILVCFFNPGPLTGSKRQFLTTLQRQPSLLQ